MDKQVYGYFEILSIWLVSVWKLFFVASKWFIYNLMNLYKFEKELKHEGAKQRYCGQILQYDNS